MRPTAWTAAVRAGVALTTLVLARPHRSDAQRVLDIGGPPGDSVSRACYTDSMLTAALAAFNGPAAVRVSLGHAVVNRGITVTGSYDVYRGSVRIDGTVQGDVIVLDGAARISSTGVVTGSLTVIGGLMVIDPGAHVGGKVFGCDQSAPLTQALDGSVNIRPAVAPLQALRSDLAWTVGNTRIAPHLGVGQYNRVEALPIEVGGSVTGALDPRDSVHAVGYGIFRTGRDPNGSRPSVGWHGTMAITHTGPVPYTAGIEGGSTVDPTVDSPLTSVESGLSSLIFRRDYSDWFLRRGGSIFVTAKPMPELTTGASWEKSHQTTVLATDAVSLLRADESWRPNPLIDDGTYQILSLQATWDGRDPRAHPVFTWYAHAELHHVSSNDLTAVSLPTTIRNAMPTTDYGETDGTIDLRGYLRFGPGQGLNMRVLGGGYLSGDPLTVQRRRAIGGTDPLPGFDFRSINCDRRRRIDPAMPALCDRMMAMQLEYHHVLPLDLSTRIEGYNIGVPRPSLVLFADAGSAWLAGDSAGRVPTGRIQDLGEWQSDIGVGVASGPVGVYIAKALSESLPLKLVALLSVRF